MLNDSSGSQCKHYLLLQEIDNEDVDAFTEAVKAYDSISRLDSWHTTLLLKVKKTINDGDLT